MKTLKKLLIAIISVFAALTVCGCAHSGEDTYDGGRGTETFEYCELAAHKIQSDGTCSVCGKDFSYLTFELNSDGTAYTVTACKDVITEAEIPSTYFNDLPVTAIGDSAFCYCEKLENITIPDSVISIGDYAFCYSGLTSITIPESVTSIGRNAFGNCSSLLSVTFKNTSSWWYADVPTAPSGTSLASTDLADDYTAAEYLTSTYAEYCWNHWSQGFIFTSNGDGTCYVSGYRGSETEVVIPAVYNGMGVTSIGEGAFQNKTSVTSITIPDSVTSIGEDAFVGCSSLTSVTIPESVTSIGGYAFLGCSSLTSVTFENTSHWHYSDDSTATSGIRLDVTNSESLLKILITGCYVWCEK